MKRPGGCTAVRDRLRLPLVAGAGFADDHIGIAIAIDDADAAFALQVGRHLPESAAGERLVACIGRGDAPVFGCAMVCHGLVGGQVESVIAGVQEVIRKYSLMYNSYGRGR